MSQVDWVPVHAMNVQPGDVVRVKYNAYSGSTGIMHNSRMCEVLEVRSGNVIVKSIDDRLPKLTETHHPPYNLEKRVVL